MPVGTTPVRATVAAGASLSSTAARFLSNSPGRLRLLVFTLTLVALPCTAMCQVLPDFPVDPILDALEAGRRICRDQASLMEETLKLAPHDLRLRLRLMGLYYQSWVDEDNDASYAMAFHKHLLYLISHYPRKTAVFMASVYEIVVNAHDLSQSVGAAWLEQIETHPEDTDIMHQAFCFFLVADRPRARSTAQRILHFEPDNGSLYFLMASLDQDDKGTRLCVGEDAFSNELVSKAFELCEDHHLRVMMHIDLAIGCYHKGEYESSRARALQAREEIGDSPLLKKSRHLTQIILGLVALKQGRLAKLGVTSFLMALPWSEIAAIGQGFGDEHAFHQRSVRVLPSHLDQQIGTGSRKPGVETTAVHTSAIGEASTPSHTGSCLLGVVGKDLEELAKLPGRCETGNGSQMAS